MTESSPNGSPFPEHVFFTGAPGSRWAATAQSIEHLDIFNTTDRKPHRKYEYNGGTFHKGMYFGRGCPMTTQLDRDYINSAWDQTQPGKIKLVKGHDWSLCLPEIKQQFPDAWVVMVYRPELTCYSWWAESGDFHRTAYPNYLEWTDRVGILSVIAEQNRRILQFAQQNQCTWHYLTSDWIHEVFGQWTQLESRGRIPAEPDFFQDVLITVVR
jgi:hypothetical protein|nr:hypothetical protein [Oxalobacteraceae bacterium]